MKKLITLSLIALIVTSCSSIQDKKEKSNAQVVVDFYDMAFNKHKPKLAADTYIGDKYIQHNPYVPNGAKPFYGYFTGYFKKNPDSSASIKRVVSQGDLVMIHVHSKQNEKDKGKAIVDIFRLENGKIVEHWDVIQEVKTDTASGNSMF
ncbi:ester cyclase [Halobacteriovorax sp. GB3]|uniref:nuclear transport factor 2 family protein n=1 Tax=Halobacteriovorax sp. GB3 TaxID=2719615 RepID=UPI00235E6286|nr:ester cyclase [Halobacteriovorax sp. GB3]MDD0854120.1 ester cyclase [Halobacteriovorax sp. GB3]